MRTLVWVMVVALALGVAPTAVAEDTASSASSTTTSGSSLQSGATALDPDPPTTGCRPNCA